VKIAWLIQGNEQWGIRSGSRALISALKPHGVSCPVVALGPGEFTDECRSLGLDVTELGLGTPPRMVKSLAKNLGLFVKLNQYERLARRLATEALRDLDADALHFRRSNLVGIGGPAAHANELPAFWHIPNAISNRHPFGINRRLYQRRCHRYGIVPLANSRYTASTLGYAPVRPQVMYLAVDPDRFDPAGIDAISRQSLGINEEAVVVGVLARLHRTKGQDRAVEATLALAGDGHDIHLLVIGGPTRGEHHDRIRKMIDGAPNGDRIHMLGPVSDAERYYPMLDFSLNCRVDPEPCGISVLESMMCETPALVHASGGPAETVIDGETGWHYHAPEAADIREGFLKAIGDRDRWPEMGTAARKHALEHFSLEAQAEHYLGIVREELARRRAQGAR
jgi:glycosyltransferase involved in cell wall biosynthesis